MNNFRHSYFPINDLTKTKKKDIIANKYYEVSKYLEGGTKITNQVSNTKQKRIAKILNLLTELYKMIISDVPLDQLPSDVTVSQLRVLLALHTGGASRMRKLAITVGVVPSTATGIIDALVKKGLVLREHDLKDRRQVICRLSPKGDKLTGMLWTWGEHSIKKQLVTLSQSQLSNMLEAVESVRNNILNEKEL